MANVNSFDIQDILALCLGSAALSGFQDVAFLSSQTSFPPTNHNMLEAVVGVSKGMLPVKYFYSIKASSFVS